MKAPYFFIALLVFIPKSYSEWSQSRVKEPHIIEVEFKSEWQVDMSLVKSAFKNFGHFSKKGLNKLEQSSLNELFKQYHAKDNTCDSFANEILSKKKLGQLRRTSSRAYNTEFLETNKANVTNFSVTKGQTYYINTKRRKRLVGEVSGKLSEDSKQWSLIDKDLKVVRYKNSDSVIQGNYSKKYNFEIVDNKCVLKTIEGNFHIQGQNTIMRLNLDFNKCLSIAYQYIYSIKNSLSDSTSKGEINNTLSLYGPTCIDMLGYFGDIENLDEEFKSSNVGTSILLE